MKTKVHINANAPRKPEVKPEVGQYYRHECGDVYQLVQVGNGFALNNLRTGTPYRNTFISCPQNVFGATHSKYFTRIDEITITANTPNQ